MSLVNHPSHYNKCERKECIVEMVEKYGFVVTATFCLISAYKYLYRAGEKEGNSYWQDIEKARWYYTWVSERIDYNDCHGLNMELYHDIGELLERKTG